MALAVLMLNVIAEGGVWTFLERIAISQGHDTRFAANVISASFFTAGAGSLLAALIGARFGRTKPFLLAVAASIASVGMFWFGAAKPVYFIAVLLFAAAWNLGSPYRMALAVSADKSGRYTTFVPAMQTLGAALGPAFAGMLIIDGSFAYVYILSITLWLVTVVLFLATTRLLRKDCNSAFPD
jgi:MFS family permease